MNTNGIMPNGATPKVDSHRASASAGSDAEENNGSFASVTRATKVSWENTARLDLPKIRVLEVKWNGSMCRYYAEAEVAAPTECVVCRKAATFRKYGTREQLFVDLPLRGDRVGIQLKKKRYSCTLCKTVRFEPLAMMDDSHRVTKRLLDYIAPASLTKTFTSLNRETGLSEKTIRRIARTFITCLDTQANIPTPRYLGLDESCFRDKNQHQKGKKQPSRRRPTTPRVRNKKRAHAILTDLQRKTIFALLRNNHRATLVKFFLQVPNREHIQVVCIDFYQSYRRAAQIALPNAELVIDKFHIMQLAHKAFEKVRLDVERQLEHRARTQLKYSRRIFRKRDPNLTPDERATLRGWTKNYLKLGQAYQAKEEFFSIWDRSDLAEARAFYRTWCENIPPEIRRFFKPVITTMRKWDLEVFAYFKWRDEIGPERKGITNALTEQLNGAIRQTLREGRGYSFDSIRGKVLYSHAFAKFQFAHKYKYLRKKGELVRHFTWHRSSHIRHQDDDVQEEEAHAHCLHIETPPAPRSYMEEVAECYLVNQAWEEQAPPRTENCSTVITAEGRQRPMRKIDSQRIQESQKEAIRELKAKYPQFFKYIDARQHARTNGQMLVNNVTGTDGEGTEMESAVVESPHLTTSTCVSERPYNTSLDDEGHHPNLAHQDPHQASLARQGTLEVDPNDVAILESTTAPPIPRRSNTP